MTSSIPQEVKRSVEPLDFNNRSHRALLFDLALANKHHLLNDHDADILLVINEYEQQWNSGYLHAFITLVNDEPVGCVWLEVDRYEIGRVHAAFGTLRAWDCLFFLRVLIGFAFESLGTRKLDSEFALYSKKDRQSACYERILKRIGFRKRTILPEALMINGKPKDTILLDYLKRDYDVKKEIIDTSSSDAA